MCGGVFVVPVMPGAPMPPAAMMPAGPMAPAGWPGYGQPAMPGYGQPTPGYGPQMPPGYTPHPGGAYPGSAYPGYPPGYGAAPGQIAPDGTMLGYGQPQTGPQFAGPFAGPAAGAFPGAEAAGFTAGEPGAGFPVIQTDGRPPKASPTAETQAPSGAASSAPAPAEQEKPAEEKEPRLVRIPCPQGHELQTPADMFNQEVLCPLCGTQFRLRYEDSVEFKEEQAELRRRKAEQLNKAALKWSIIAAVVVVVGILGMIVYLVVRAPSDKWDSPPDAPAQEAAANSSEEAGAPEVKQPSRSEVQGDGDAEPDRSEK